MMKATRVATAPLRGLNRALARSLPPAVRFIFVLNLVVFAIVRLSMRIFPRESVQGIIFEFFAENPDYSIPYMFLYQFVTYMFIHLQWEHLIYNMLLLWFFAPELEWRWGESRFWRFYLTTGIGAGLFHAVIALLFGSERAPILGASAPLFGVLLAMWSYYPHRMAYFPGGLRLKFTILLPLLIVIEIAAMGRVGDGISHITHVAGVGVAFFYLAKYHRTSDFRLWRYRG